MFCNYITMMHELLLFDYNVFLLLGLLVLGVLIGMIATIAGIGGGMINMPFFLLILHFDPMLAKGTSLFTIFLSSGFALYIHWKKGKIHLISSFIMSIFAILGSLACTLVQLAITVDDLVFYIIFGIFEISMGIRLGLKGVKIYPEEKRKRQEKAQDGDSLPNLDAKYDEEPREIQKPTINLIQNPKLLIKAIPLFFLAGFVAAFFGIGGGAINTPTLHEVFNLPIHYATAGSTAIIFFVSIFNTISYGLQGAIDWAIGISLGIGMIVGARIGAKTASKIPRWLTLIIIAVVLIFTGFKIIFGAF
ncbi:MAG: sulfite exporter TauE/SafE family protein [Promethearchaeota archaeon]